LATEKHNRRYKCSYPIQLPEGKITSVITSVERGKENITN